ncbi:jg17500 [Pararge aegeria aegeria]|uniref:Jg17500 protein n=1 Tax=Pararge aegeria aegeria TaxID=348720 RepID=A0A8S4R3S0_9NEOP|nr:jg17500 [Pararge aegeria aegeria]
MKKISSTSYKYLRTTGMTPLMYAVKDNRTSFVERLIELGSDVGARNNDNYNVLHISAMYSREDIVKLLLSKRGVDPFATGGSRQQTAVHIVASRQTGTATSILRALLTAAGKDIRLRTDGVIPLQSQTASSRTIAVQGKKKATESPERKEEKTKKESKL